MTIAAGIVATEDGHFRVAVAEQRLAYADDRRRQSTRRKARLDAVHTVENRLLDSDFRITSTSTAYAQVMGMFDEAHAEWRSATKDMTAGSRFTAFRLSLDVGGQSYRALAVEREALLHAAQTLLTAYTEATEEERAAVAEAKATSWRWLAAFGAALATAATALLYL